MLLNVNVYNYLHIFYLLSAVSAKTMSGFENCILTPNSLCDQSRELKTRHTPLNQNNKKKKLNFLRLALNHPSYRKSVAKKNSYPTENPFHWLRISRVKTNPFVIYYKVKMANTFTCFESFSSFYNFKLLKNMKILILLSNALEMLELLSLLENLLLRKVLL